MRATEVVARLLPTVVAVAAVWAYEIRFPLGPAMIAAAVAVDAWRWRSLSRRPRRQLSRRAVRMPEIVILFFYAAVFGTLFLAIQVEGLGGQPCLPELQAAIGTIFNTANRQLLRTGGFCDGPLAAPTFVMLVLAPVCLSAYASWKALMYDLDPDTSVNGNLLPLLTNKHTVETRIVWLSLFVGGFFIVNKLPYVITIQHLFNPSERIDGFITLLGIVFFSIIGINSAFWVETRMRRVV